MILGTLSIVLLVVAGGLATGQLRGARLDRVRAVRMRALPLAVAALAVQLLLGLPLPRPGGALRLIGPGLAIVSLWLLLVVACANRRLPGIRLVALGLLAELLVVGVNGGLPVSQAALERARIPASGAYVRELGPKYVMEGPATRLVVLDARLAVPPVRTVLSVGDVVQYAGLLLLVQGLMLPGPRRRRRHPPERGTTTHGRDDGAPRNGRGPAARRPGTGLRWEVPAGGWATLLRVAWLAVLLGLLLQLALLLAAARFGTVAGWRPLAAETARNVAWSVLVCSGIAVGRVAATSRPQLMGVTGLLAAPLALDVANTIQKGLAAALDLNTGAGGLAPLWMLALKAAEYGCLGAALGWIGRRAWGGAVAHAAAGLVAGLTFGSVVLVVVARSAPIRLPASVLLARGVNELLFPVGCALVVFTATILGDRLGPTRTQPPGVSFAATGEQEADQVMRPLMEGLAAGGPPLERLRRFVAAYGQALEGDARFRAVVDLLLFGGAVPEASRQQTRLGFGAWLGAFEAVLEEARQQGELRPGVSPCTAARAVVALTVGITTTTVHAPGLLAPAEAAALLEALLRGIARAGAVTPSERATGGRVS